MHLIVAGKLFQTSWSTDLECTSHGFLQIVTHWNETQSEIHLGLRFTSKWLFPAAKCWALFPVN